MKAVFFYLAAWSYSAKRTILAGFRVHFRIFQRLIVFFCTLAVQFLFFFVTLRSGKNENFKISFFAKDKAKWIWKKPMVFNKTARRPSKPIGWWSCCFLRWGVAFRYTIANEGAKPYTGQQTARRCSAKFFLFCYFFLFCSKPACSRLSPSVLAPI